MIWIIYIKVVFLPLMKKRCSLLFIGIFFQMFCFSVTYGQNFKFVKFDDEKLECIYEIPEYLEDQRKSLLSPHSFVRNGNKLPMDKCVQCLLSISMGIEAIDDEDISEVAMAIRAQLDLGIGRNRQYSVEDLEVNKTKFFITSNVITEEQPIFIYQAYMFSNKPKQMVVFKFKFLAFKDGDKYIVSPEHKKSVLTFLNSISPKK